MSTQAESLHDVPARPVGTRRARAIYALVIVTYVVCVPLGVLLAVLVVKSTSLSLAAEGLAVAGLTVAIPAGALRAVTPRSWFRRPLLMIEEAARLAGRSVRALLVSRRVGQFGLVLWLFAAVDVTVRVIAR